MESINMKSIGLNVFTHSNWFNFNEETIKWGSIYLKIVNQIPLFNFLNKLIHAYPNADRNFNL